MTPRLQTAGSGGGDDVLRQGLSPTRRLHAIQLAAAVAFGTLALVWTRCHAGGGEDGDDLAVIAAWIIALGAVGFSWAVPFMARSITPGQPTPANAVPRYQVVCLMRWVVLDGAVFFAGLAALMAGSAPCLNALAFSLVALAWYRPSRRELVRLFLAPATATPQG